MYIQLENKNVITLENGNEELDRHIVKFDNVFEDYRTQ